MRTTMVMASLLACLLTSGAFAQALSPDLRALQGLVEELTLKKPPMDPVDAGAIRDDAVSAISNVASSMVPYQGIPEALYAARLGQRIANLFYHRFSSPDLATSVITQVRATYTSLGPTASLIAASTGAQASATSALPTGFSPGDNATSESGTWSCSDPPSPAEVDALLIGANAYYRTLGHPEWAVTSGSYKGCAGGDGGPVYVELQIVGQCPGDPLTYVSVWVVGDNLNSVTFNTGA